jgi:8-oxo-dGTP pyrophosphatase MutT (NUDIX family)
MADIHKIGLLTVRDDGCVLLCRKKRGTALLILPGGKPEPAETSLECLRRELREELGAVEPRELEYLGTYTDVAAGEVARTLQIELYKGTLEGTPMASAEIGELVWFGEKDDPALLAPSLRNRVFPDLIARGILPWESRRSALR